MAKPKKTAAKAVAPKVEQKTAPKTAPKVEQESVQKPEPKTAKAKGPAAVTVAGTGTIRLRTADTVRRVPRGEPVEVTPAEVAYLTRAGIEFTTEK